MLHSRASLLHSLQIRVFDDPATGSMWKQSVKDIDGDILCVSQFTLFANTHKGNKPDFHRAMVIYSLCSWPSNTSHAVLPCRARKSRKRCIPSFWSAWASSTSPKRSKVSPLVCTNTWASQRIRTDGRFGAMMNVSLTNEVRGEHRYPDAMVLRNESSLRDRSR